MDRDKFAAEVRKLRAAGAKTFLAERVVFGVSPEDSFQENGEWSKRSALAGSLRDPLRAVASLTEEAFLRTAVLLTEDPKLTVEMVEAVVGSVGACAAADQFQKSLSLGVDVEAAAVGLLWRLRELERGAVG